MRKRRKSGNTRLPRRVLNAETLEPRQLLTTGLIISEFMASNGETLPDGDGNSSDWVEIYNAGETAVDLAGYRLTDSQSDLSKWIFPSRILDANSYSVVFASGQDAADYIDAEGNLHTDFRLGAGGEYLALVSPEGAILSEYGTGGADYPAQVRDVSYGITQARTLVSGNNDAMFWTPLDGSLGDRWVETDFDAVANGFSTGKAAIGYEDSPTGRNHFADEIQTELSSRTHAVYSRMEFTLDDASLVTALTLNLKYDNGFIVYLNGEKVLEENVPEDPEWYSTAPDGSRRDSAALEFAEFDLAPVRDRLVDGKNVLAIHGLNNLVRDQTDMLIVPRLTAAVNSPELLVGYLPTPSPGGPNIAPDAVMGPLVGNVTENPGALEDSQDLVVTANVNPLNAPVQSITLVYRVMYGDEFEVPMVDDGTGADAAAGDGTFTATIPHAAAGPGEMVRWYVLAIDNEGNTSRAPHFFDQVDQSQSPEYFGTVIADPSVETQLPVYEWFVETPRSAETGQGTRASLLYDGEFYDNIFVRIRGGTARSWPKKSYKVEFNDDYLFRFRDDVPRVDEFNLNTTYTDKSYMRSVLTYELQRDAGTPSPDSFHVRLHQNGEFYSVAIFVEQPDRSFLRRNGLDDEGALYKGGPGSTLLTAGPLEKKTRQDEDKSDAQALVDGLKLRGEELEEFLFDNIDIPALANFMATVIITQNIDASDKNYYLHRDTDGSGEWQMLPWDLDLTFGPDALNTDTMIADENRRGAGNPNAVHPFLGSRRYPLHGGKVSELQDGLIENPRFREMFLRRIRTLADQFLATDYFTSRIDELIAMIAPDVELDKARWRNSAHFSGRTYTLVEANDRIKDEYLAPRLPYLTTRQSELSERQGGVGIPEAQLGYPLITFGTIEFEPPSGIQDEEYIELVNPNPFAVDISGWRLEGGAEITFKPGTVIPAGQSLYLSPDVRVFRARSEGPRGGQGLFVQGGYDGHLSSEGEPLTLLAADGTPVHRTFVGGEPTELEESLRITEISYHPHGPNLVDGLGEIDDGTPTAADRFEFVELTNTGDAVLDLSDARLSHGIDFTFAPGTSLVPAEQILVVHDRAAFESRHGSKLNIAGEFTGTLDDGGEHLFLDGPNSRVVQSFAYGSSADWPQRAGGRGSTLEIVDTGGDYSDPANWRQSDRFGGSPGIVASELGDPVVINEVLANSSAEQLDAVELRNTGGQVLDLSHWFLSDSADDYFKFQVPAGTTIEPLAYQAFDQNQLGFDLDGVRGGHLWLVSADASGRPFQFVDRVEFGSAGHDVSLGPFPTSHDPFMPLAVPTLGSENSGHLVGEVVISEVHYSPIDPDRDRPEVPDDFEFIELYNRTDHSMEVGGWQLAGGVDFVLPAGSKIDAGQTLIIVGFDTSDLRQESVFRFIMGVPQAATVIGPYAGPLDDAAGSLQLLRPGESPEDAPSLTPLVLADQITYAATTPWPPSASGLGDSLSRTQPGDFGDFPTSWVASPPSPGMAEFSPRQMGDANEDGKFDQADLVLVLQADKYKTGEPATWEQGDWTGDGRFDQLDILAALQSGQYATSPQAALGPENRFRSSVLMQSNQRDDATDLLFSQIGELTFDRIVAYSSP